MPGDRANADRVSLDESVNRLLQVALESLTVEQRVAFILHDVFGVPFGGVGDVVGRTAASSRELTRSARQQIQQRQRLQAPDGHHREVVCALLAGCNAQDEAAVKSTLHAGVTALIDSGGKVAAGRESCGEPVRGADRVAGLVMRLVARVPGISISEQSVNGYTGLVFRREGRAVGVLSANVVGERILDIWIVVDPDKLRHWNAA